MARHATKANRRLCTVCGWQPATARDALCPTCRAYRRRTGRDRPPDVIAAHCRRLLGPPDPTPTQPRLPLAG